MTETILLTGISGFIAKHIAVKLLNAGYGVRGTVRTLDRGAEVLAAVRPHLADPASAARLTFAALDLTADAGWADAMQGIDAVIHTASPFPLAQPKNPEDLIRPAVDGTRRVLKAALAAGITRVVLTSSTVAVIDNRVHGVQDEANWCHVEAADTSAYARSKTLAERAAWDFVKDTGQALTTVNPGFVVGPPLDANFGSSINVVKRLMAGKDPMLPEIGFPMVDVRDVAEMHLRALQRPTTAGKRYLAVAGSMWMVDMGRTLKTAYPTRRIATRQAPRLLLRALGLFDPAIRLILPGLGRMENVSNARAVADMGMDFITPQSALRAAAEWLVAHKQV